MLSLRTYSLTWHCLMKSNVLTTLCHLKLTFLANCCIIIYFTECSRGSIKLQNYDIAWTGMFLFSPSCTSSCTLFCFYSSSASIVLPVNVDDCSLLSQDEDKKWDMMQVTKKKHYHLQRKSPMPIWIQGFLFALCLSDVLVERMIE